jgi:alkylhydroperoxidase family enzyme
MRQAVRVPNETETSWPSGDVVGLRPELAEPLRALVQRSADRLPGRLDTLMSARVEQLRGRAVADDELADLVRHSTNRPALSDGERAVIALTEQFVIDVRGIGDNGFGAVKAHYSDDEVAAISFRLALLEGMSKFDTLFPGGSV